MKLYNCVQTISIRQEYLKPYDCVCISIIGNICGVMVIAAGNQHGNPSSNPG